MAESEDRSSSVARHGVDFVIVTALAEEREAVLAKLPGCKRLDPIPDDIRIYYSADVAATFPSGVNGIYQVIVIPLLGMGRVQATIATADAIRRWKPRYVILVGIAGGVAAKGMQLGDVLVPDQIIDYELQKQTEEKIKVRWEVYRTDPKLLGDVANSGEDWQQLIGTTRPGTGMSRCHIGPMLSGDKVIADSKILAKYSDVWDKLIGVELEAGGVACTSFQSADAPGFFMIRGVSDLADNKKDSGEVQEWRAYACDVAASYAIALLKSGPIPIRTPAVVNGGQSTRIEVSHRLNPFVYGRPVQPSEFVDREDSLRTVFNRLRSGESTAIVGEPHIGKSSLLMQLADIETQLRYLGDDIQKIVFCKLDVHYFGSDSSPNTFWEKALKPLRKIPGQDDIAWRLDRLVETSYPSDSLVEFFEYLRKRKQQVALLIDEFDQLLKIPEFQHFIFYAALRSVANSRGLAIVLASRLALKEIEEQVLNLPFSGGSPPFNYLIEVRLKPFDEKGVAALLSQAGEALSPEERIFIQYVAGRHPYLIQAMAGALLETTGESRWARAATLCHDQICPHYDDVWRTLDDRTRTTALVLGLLEIGKCKFGDSLDYREIQALSNLGAGLWQLDQLGLAERTSPNCLSITGGLFYQGECWTLGARAFTCWICQVAVNGSRRVPSYNGWLNSEGYRSLLTREQWEQLLDTVHSIVGKQICDIGTTAEKMFRESARRRENETAS